jgi:hypothetical protein
MALQDLLDAEQAGTIDPAKKAALDEARKRGLPSVMQKSAEPAPQEPVQPEQSTFQKIKEGAKNLVTTKEGAKTLGRTVADVAIPAAADIVMAPVAAMTGPAAPVVEIATNMAANEAVQVGANILFGRKWNEGIGETALVSGVAGGLAKAVGSTVKAFSRSAQNTEAAFTKVYGAIQDAVKGDFSKLKQLPYFSEEEKKAILAIPPGANRKSHILSLLDTKDDYQTFLKRGGNAKSALEASEFYGEKVQAKEVGSALDRAEARLAESSSPERRAATNEDIINLRKKIFEEHKGVITSRNIQGINDDIEYYLNKYEKKDVYSKADPAYQIFTDIKSSLTSDLDQSGAKMLRMGNRLYARENSLNKIFDEGFTTGSVIDTTEKQARSGLNKFNGEKFRDSIKESRVLSDVEKDDLYKLGSKIKGFQEPTMKDFSDIRTAEAALSRHIAMKAALGGAGIGAIAGGAAGYQKGNAEAGAGAGAGGLVLAGIGLLGAKGIARHKMIGSILRTAVNLPGGKEALAKELDINNGVLTRKAILSLSNLIFSSYKQVGDEQQEEGNKYKQELSKRIIDKTQKEHPELQGQ